MLSTLASYGDSRFRQRNCGSRLGCRHFHQTGCPRIPDEWAALWVITGFSSVLWVKESCCLSLQTVGWVCYVFTCILLIINPRRILDSTCLFNIEIWCSHSHPQRFPWMVTFLSYLNDVLHYTFWQRPVRALEVGVGLFQVCDTYGEEILCERAVLTKERETIAMANKLLLNLGFCSRCQHVFICGICWPWYGVSWTDISFWVGF